MDGWDNPLLKFKSCSRIYVLQHTVVPNAFIVSEQAWTENLGRFALIFNACCLHYTKNYFYWKINVQRSNNNNY